MTASGLIQDIREMIETTYSGVTATANAGLTMLHWRSGGRTNQETLGKCADYGPDIVSTVSRQLEGEFGGGIVEKNLRRMIQFIEVFPDKQFVVSLIRQLIGTHSIEDHRYDEEAPYVR
jgi:hypothetical protein